MGLESVNVTGGDFYVGGFVGSNEGSINNDEDASPAAIIAGSNHFEVAIAVAITLFGVSSGAALATVVGVLTEVPFMLILVQLCKATRGTFSRRLPKAEAAKRR